MLFLKKMKYLLLTLMLLTTSTILAQSPEPDEFKASTAPSDSAITSSVQSNIAGNKVLTGKKIQVYTQDGIVILTGVVDDQNQENEAISAARAATGVKDVTSRLYISVP